MELYDNNLYIEDLKKVAELNVPWNTIKDSSILISGASGMIGSFFVDVIMYKNFTVNLNCKIYALGRNLEKLERRFLRYLQDENFYIIQHDINEPLVLKQIEKIDYIFHLASNTHPLQYSGDPIGTICTNILGLKNMLDLAVLHNAKRFIFASSNEIYGENRGDIEKFDEKYCGYINCNTVRAGYPESKRCGEAMCQAYLKQKKLDVVISRFTRTYGPTLLKTDSKALSQFLHKGINGEDIVLKSKGMQYYSYTYVADAVSGLLTLFFYGKQGEAYNISYEKSDIRLKDLAELIANVCGKKVIYELPDEHESAGYSTATKARLDNKKLSDLGWRPQYDIRNGIEKTLKILTDMEECNI